LILLLKTWSHDSLRKAQFCEKRKKISMVEPSNSKKMFVHKEYKRPFLYN